MLLFYLRYTRNTGSKNPKVVKTKNGRIMSLLECKVCHSKKSKFINKQEASGFLSSKDPFK